jgi:hypothetical protein
VIRLQHDSAHDLEAAVAALARALRNVTLIWQAYLHHLPLSGGHFFPASLDKGEQMLRSLFGPIFSNFWRKN